jgi:hypothetical protein
VGFDETLADTPDDPQSNLIRGLALAYLGEKAAAMKAGERGISLVQARGDGYTGPYLHHQLMRIYILAGATDKALDQLEALLQMPYFLSPGWLRIDPTFDPLRQHPRFRKLVEGPP